MRLAAALLLLCGTHALTATGPQPVVWSLAGSDSSAGAGVEADLRAFRCLGARGCAVVTALTAQSTTGVEAVLETPAAHVAATIAALEADLPPAAVKTGALGGAGAARAVAAFLRRAPPCCKVVVDPLVGSTSGRRLLGLQELLRGARYTGVWLGLLRHVGVCSFTQHHAFFSSAPPL